MDSKFDYGGIVKTDINGTEYDGSSYDVILQSDGKIISAGWVESEMVSDFVAVRYYTDGSLDNTTLILIPAICPLVFTSII